MPGGRDRPPSAAVGTAQRARLAQPQFFSASCFGRGHGARPARAAHGVATSGAGNGVPSTSIRIAVVEKLTTRVDRPPAAAASEKRISRAIQKVGGEVAQTVDDGFAPVHFDALRDMRGARRSPRSHRVDHGAREFALSDARSEFILPAPMQEREHHLCAGRTPRVRCRARLLFFGPGNPRVLRRRLERARVKFVSPAARS